MTNHDIRIQAMKGYVRSYLTWKAVGKDASGKEITPEITARYEEICRMLKEEGVTCP